MARDPVTITRNDTPNISTRLALDRSFRKQALVHRIEQLIAT